MKPTYAFLHFQEARISRLEQTMSRSDAQAAYGAEEMNPRVRAFRAFEQHPWHGKRVSKLKAEELLLAHEFMVEHAKLSAGDFELAVNRMFLFRERPKNWTLILELLTMANTAASPPQIARRVPSGSEQLQRAKAIAAQRRKPRRKA